jgi:hypothetical protein
MVEETSTDIGGDMAGGKGGDFDIPPEKLTHDAVRWEEAANHISSAKKKADQIHGSVPSFGARFAALKKSYEEKCNSVVTFLGQGTAQIVRVDDTLRTNASRQVGNDQKTQTSMDNLRKSVNNGGEKYKNKLEGHIGEVPEHPNNPKDDKVYDRLEDTVNRLLEEDGTRLNAFDTDDAFDRSQETVVAYTDADGKVHVISTNPNQGTHAQDLTISFLDEEGNMHVVTSVDGQMVEDTVAPNGTSERRVVMQGNLDQMMAEAKEVSISYTDDKGVETVVSTDKDQGGQMNQVVVAYADEHGQQHMVSNETGIDTPRQGSGATAHLAYGSATDSQFQAGTFQGATSPAGGKA